MEENPIIRSILDNDLYKFTMQQLVLHQYHNASACYSFKCRNKDVKLGFLADRINKQLRFISKLSLTAEEESYMRSLSFIKDDYVNYLKKYYLNIGNVYAYDRDGDLYVEIFGLWLETIWFEVPILSIINQLYFEETTNEKKCLDVSMEKLDEKIKILKANPGIKICEFGTRRRYSVKNQELVYKKLLKECPENIIGTSNVLLGMQTGSKVIGTMAHEYISAHLSLVSSIKEAQKRALYVWIQEYDKNLSIALTDTFTTDVFFRDFGSVLSNVYDGVRHDSGCPYKFGEKVISHYERLGIDPTTKTIVFSDSLDIPSAIKIYNRFYRRIKVSFGIGTNLTNDVGVIPLNIVIKLIKCNSSSVVKLSDNSGKHIGNSFMIENVINALGITKGE